MRPAALAEPLEAPAPEVLSRELMPRDMVVIGNLLHVHSYESKLLEPWQLAAAMETACTRAEGHGFRGVVFYDHKGDVSRSCLRTSDDGP